MARHEIRIDLSGTDLAALHTEGDIRQEVRRLLPAALKGPGRALAEAAWAGVLERSPGPTASPPAGGGEPCPNNEPCPRSRPGCPTNARRGGLHDSLIIPCPYAI